MSKAVKQVVGVVAAVAIPFAAPAIVGAIAGSTAIAAAMPAVTAALSTTVGATVGSAIVGAGLGAVSAKVTGGDVGRGALMGAIGGGIGGYTQAGNIAAQGSQATAAATPTSATGAIVEPTANAVVTNVGSGTGYYSPELGSYVDPMTGNAIAPQNIAYGGTVDSAVANQLSSGAIDSSSLANSMQNIAVNTPGAVGGSPVAFGSAGGAYYNPDAAASAFVGPTNYAPQTAPTYAQAGLQSTPAMEQAIYNQAVQSGEMVNVAGAGGKVSTVPAGSVQAGAGAGTAQTGTAITPATKADMMLRAAGMLAGNTLAGDGLSDEERQLLNEQTAELRQLRETNEELFNQRLQEAQNLVGESKYFDPAYFGLQSERAVKRGVSKAKREALRGIGKNRAGLRAAEERRFDLAGATGGETAYLQGADTAQQNRIRTLTSGLSAMPTSGNATSLQYGSYLGGLYDAADRRRRQTAQDVGDLFGSFTGDQKARNAGLTINLG